MAAGRPSKLTDQLLTKLDETAESFWSIVDACAHLGIHRSTYTAWRNQGDADREADIETKFSRFSDIAIRVGGPLRRQLADSALKACLMDPNATHDEKIRAAAIILRLDSASKLEVSGPEGGPIETALKGFEDSISRMIENKGRV